MTIRTRPFDVTRDVTRLTRRELLKAGGLALGALSVGTPALGQTPRSGGTLVSAQSTEATGLDPQLVPAFSRSRRSPLMYNQPVRFDPEMNPVPELAESWDVSKDGLTWTFRLRQGVKFHDGQELTSADVKFTFDRLVEKSPGKGDFVTVDKIEPTGKYGIKFVTKERRADPAHHPRREQYRRRAQDRADPARLHRGQQELQPPEGREDPDRLPQLPSRLRLRQHQREPRPAEGCAGAPGD
jgi:Bacterial extracellular solute-binding proteins, family 5 Middle